MMSIARLSDSVSTLDCAVGLPRYTSSTPPFRSRPRRVFFAFTAPGMPAITNSSETMISPATISRTSELRRRSAIARRLLLGGQDEQQAAVVVVRREHVRLRAGRHVAFSAHQHGHLQRAHAPLEHRLAGVLAALEPG